MNTGELMQRLERHYIRPSDPMPGGAFLTEVCAPLRGRRIDALYVGFTSSRGHLIEGHELKVTRADWLHELDQPHKAEWWFKRTHRWWVVAPDVETVRPEELPPGWGLMTPQTRSKTRLLVVVKPAERKPLVDFGLFHEVVKKLDTMRAEQDRQHQSEIDRLVREALDKRITSQTKDEVKMAHQLEMSAREAIRAFEEASGVLITKWDAGKIGEAVRLIVNHEESVERALARLTRIGSEAERLARDVKESRKKLEAGDRTWL